MSDLEKIKGHKCGRIQRRLESLMHRYNDLYAYNSKERYTEYEKTETNKLGGSRDLDSSLWGP